MINKLAKLTLLAFIGLMLLISGCTNKAIPKDDAYNTAVSNEIAVREKPNVPNMTEVKIRSKEINDNFIIDITLPDIYDKNKKYPVIYMTDGYWRIDQHKEIHEMSTSKAISDVIVVGIGYPEGYDYNKIRVRDLINNPEPFLNFIVDTVIPYIDNNYSTDTTDRTLWGASYGGTFALYSLFQSEDKTKNVFKNYIIVSPVINPTTNEQSLFNLEKNLSTKTKKLPENIYMAIGGLENNYLPNYNKMVNMIEGRCYSELNFTHEVVPELDHYTVWEPSLIKGVKNFYKINE